MGNGLRDFLCKALDCQNCPDLHSYVSRIQSLTDTTIVLEKDKEALRSSLKNVRENYQDLQATFVKIKGDYESLLANSSETEIERFWNNKYPKADIEYSGRTYPTTKEKVKIDVRLFLTQFNDWHIHKFLRENDLYHKGGDFGDTAVKIRKWIEEVHYKYEFDYKNYNGVSELWEFPFEIFTYWEKEAKRPFDCDSWAILQANFYIAAGIPDWKVRVVVGETDVEPHATVYVHSDIDNRFHHLNSTSWIYKSPKLVDYPLPIDSPNSGDPFGIWGVWFSFNNKHAWHEFTTGAAEGFSRKGKQLFAIKKQRV